MTTPLFRDEAHRRAGYWVITSNWFVYSGQACVLPHLTRYYELDLGLDDTRIGLLMAVPALFAMVMYPTWGVLADKVFGRTLAFRIVATLACLSLLVFSLIPRIQSFAILMLAAIGVVTMYRGTAPLLTSITLSFLGDGRRHMFGRIRVFGSLSFALTIVALCPILAEMAPLLGLHPRTPIFWAGSLLFLLALFCTRWDESQFQPHVKPTAMAFRQLLSNRNLLNFYLAFFAVGVGASVGFMYIGPFIEYKGQSDFFFGLMWFSGVGAEVLISATLHRWIRSFGLKRFIVLALLAEGLRWVGMSYAESPVLYLLLFLLHGPSVVGIFFVAAMYLDSECDESVRSTAQTLLAMSVMAGHITGYWLGSLYLDSITGMQRAEAIQSGFFYFGSVALVGSLYAALMVRPETEPPAPSSSRP